ncbi:DUF881 domain-containing protein [soil metagenome]
MPDADDAAPEQPEQPVVDGSSEPGAPVLAEERLSGRERLVRAVRQPSRSQVVVGVLLALVGFAGVVQVRATESDSTYSSYREQDLIDVLNGLASTTQRTQAEIDRLTAARSDLQSDSSRRQAAIDQAQKDVDSLNVLAGLVPVTGPGIRITVTEKTGTVGVSSMLDTIEELRSTGAEAIQVNGQVRVVAQTSFEEAVGGLSVDGTVVESPYIIDAIGLAGAMAGAIEFPLGPSSKFEADGATVDVVQLASLDIDAVRKPVQPEFAQPES